MAVAKSAGVVADRVAEAEGPEFQVLATGVLIEDLRKPNDRDVPPNRSQCIRGDIAIGVPGCHGLVARWYVPDSDSEPAYGYRSWDPAAPAAPSEWTVQPCATMALFVAMYREHARGKFVLESPLEKTAERFETDYPGLLAAISPGFSAPKWPDGVFGLGEVFQGAPMNLKAADVDIRPYLLRHQSADFGLHGLYDPAPLTAAEAWAIGLLSVARRNSEVIRRGYGVVTSSYELPTEIAGQLVFDHVRETAAHVGSGYLSASTRAIVSVATLVTGSGRNQTVVVPHAGDCRPSNLF